MSQLRDKDDGCEWDKEQTFRSIAPYTIEEAYEVADAIEREDISCLLYTSPSPRDATLSRMPSSA